MDSRHHRKTVNKPQLLGALTFALLLTLSSMLWTLTTLAGGGWERLPTDEEIGQAASAALATVSAEDWTTLKRHDANQPVQNPVWVNSVLLVWIEPNPHYPYCDPQKDPDCKDPGPPYWCGVKPLEYENGWRFAMGDGAQYEVNDLSSCISCCVGDSPGWIGAPPTDNHPPTVTLTFTPGKPSSQDTIHFEADAADPDGDPLTYTWYLNGTQQTGATQSSVQWSKPAAGKHTLKVVVSDGKGGSNEASVTFTVGDPLELELKLTSDPVWSDEYGFTFRWCVSAQSYYPEKDQVTHEYFYDGVRVPEFSFLQSGERATSEACWVNPAKGTHVVLVRASDGKGNPNEKSTSFTVGADWAQVRVIKGVATIRGGGVSDQTFEEGTSVSITADVMSNAPISIEVTPAAFSLDGRGEALSKLVFSNGTEIYIDYSHVGNPGLGHIPVTFKLGISAYNKWHSDVGLGQGNVRVHYKIIGGEWENVASYAVIGVLGTDYELVQEPDGTVTVNTFEGTVEVSDTNRTKTVKVRAGQTTTVSPRGVPMDPAPFDPDSIERWWDIPDTGGQPLAKALDANGNNLLDDAEIRQAVQYWILGQTVPGANQAIDDAKIRQLIQMWILGTPVSADAAG